MIMSDQRMPGMTGRRAAAPGQGDPSRDDAPAVHGLCRYPDRDRRDQPGPRLPILAKPWDPEELEVVVRQAVEHHDLIVEKNRLLAELQADQRQADGGQPAQGGLHRGRQPRAQYAGEPSSWAWSSCWKMSLGEMPARPSGSGSTGSAPRRVGWPGRSSGCSSWSAAASSAAARTETVAHRAAGPPGRRRARSRISSCAGSPWPSTIEPGPGPDRGRSGQDRRRPDQPPGQRRSSSRPTAARSGSGLGRAGPTDWVRVSVSDEGLGVPAERSAIPVRAVLHRLRHAAPLLGRLPVRQAGDRPGTLAGQDVRRAARRAGRGRQQPPARARRSRSSCRDPRRARFARRSRRARP